MHRSKYNFLIIEPSQSKNSPNNTLERKNFSKSQGHVCVRACMMELRAATMMMAFLCQYATAKMSHAKLLLVLLLLSLPMSYLYLDSFFDLV